MHPRIKNILENYTYPIIKSIAYPNGDMLVLEGQWLGEEYHLRILCQSTLDSYFKYNEAKFMFLIYYPQKVAEKWSNMKCMEVNVVGKEIGFI